MTAISRNNRAEPGVTRKENKAKDSLRDLTEAMEAEVSEQVLTRLKTEEGGLGLVGSFRTLSPEQESYARQVIREELHRYNRFAARLNKPFLSDVGEAARNIFNQLFGLGKLQPLLEDPTIEDIFINAPDEVLIIQNGIKRKAPIHLGSNAQVLEWAKRAAFEAGRRVDESSPMLDLQLPGGARMNVIIPPVARDNVLVTIRNHNSNVRRLEDLVAGGVLSRSAATFLSACVAAGLNILIAGATGSGKTTLLNCLGSLIDPQERVIIIEETSELNFPISDCLHLQARSANIEGQGEVTLGDLVRNALRMRPTWLIVGEVRGGEALDMLRSMTTGHSSGSTIHSNSAAEALTALKTCAMQAPGRPSPEVVTELIRQAIDIVVHLVMVKKSNRRYVSSILEVVPGGEELQVSTNEIFQVRFKDGRKDRPYLNWSGLVPRCLPRLEEVGLDWRAQILGEEESLEETGEEGD